MVQIRRLYWRQFWNHQDWTRIHLVPSIMADWDDADRALCGQVVNHHEAHGDSGTGTHGVCKRCLLAARKRGMEEYR